MAIRIELDAGHGPSVARDLSKICPDPSLLMDIESRTIPGPDGGMVTAFGNGGVVLQNRPNPNDTSVVIGTQLIAALTDPNLEGTVVIHGLGSNDISDLDNLPIRSAGGKTTPHIPQGGASFVYIDYDTEGCNRGSGFKSGYVATPAQSSG